MPLRRFFINLFSISLAITLIITSQASTTAWNNFFNSSKQWTRSIAGLFTNSHINLIASAQAIQNEMNNWQNWPSSFRIKYFDGGWIMPFELYELQAHRFNPYGNESARAPVYTDLNGDGLVDMLFSSTSDSFTESGSSSISNIEMKQYIALNNGKQFELVYKCRYGTNSQGSSFKYYGDCADTTANQSPIVKHPPRMPIEMILHHQNKLQPISKTGTEGNIGATLNIDGNIATTIIEEKCHNKGLDVAGCDRYMPKLMDLNGDGLQDIILSSQIIERYVSAYPFQVQRKQSMILYNNGQGFDLDHLCYDIADIDVTGSTSPYRDFGFANYAPWPSAINPTAQTYYCLLGNN